MNLYQALLNQSGTDAAGTESLGIKHILHLHGEGIRIKREQRQNVTHGREPREQVYRTRPDPGPQVAVKGPDGRDGYRMNGRCSLFALTIIKALDVFNLDRTRVHPSAHSPMDLLTSWAAEHEHPEHAARMICADNFETGFGHQTIAGTASGC